MRIGGLKVGSVRDIRIDQDHAAVIVFVDIPAKYIIDKDASIQVQHGLTGAAGININNLGSGGASRPTNFSAAILIPSRASCTSFPAWEAICTRPWRISKLPPPS